MSVRSTLRAGNPRAGGACAACPKRCNLVVRTVFFSRTLFTCGSGSSPPSRHGRHLRQRPRCSWAGSSLSRISRNSGPNCCATSETPAIHRWCRDTLFLSFSGVLASSNRIGLKSPPSSSHPPARTTAQAGNPHRRSTQKPRPTPPDGAGASSILADISGIPNGETSSARTVVTTAPGLLPRQHGAGTVPVRCTWPM